MLPDQQHLNGWEFILWVQIYCWYLIGCDILEHFIDAHESFSLGNPGHAGEVSAHEGWVRYCLASSGYPRIIDGDVASVKKQMGSL